MRSILFGCGALAAALFAEAQTPEISFIEVPTNAPSLVYIHFYTDPGHTYYLQYNNSVVCTNCGDKLTMATNWSNLFTGYNLPFAEHYVITDTRTNKSRFYRLRMTTP